MTPDAPGSDRFIAIANADDPRIAAYLNIRERDLVGRQGLFIAEGEVVLRVLSATPHVRCLSVLIDPKRLDKLRPILDALPPDAPIYLAEQAVLSAIAGFDLHRGVLALAELTQTLSVAELLARASPKGRCRTRVVVLFGIGNHDNMGGVFRNAAAFGVAAVLLDPTCCDPLYRKAIRVSVGGVLAVPFARFEVGDDPLAMLQAAGLEPIALSPSGAETLSTMTPPARAAVLLGAEGPGLDPALLARSRTVRIPMAGGFDSLNVATTSALVLHHLSAD